jgi:hypothetical protein
MDPLTALAVWTTSHTGNATARSETPRRTCAQVVELTQVDAS